MTSDDGASSSASIEFALNGVCKSFGRHTVFRDVDLEIPHGQRVAFIGPSGTGKTTMLRLLAAIIWPDSGTIHAFDRDTALLRGRGLRAVRRDIGVLYQSDHLIPNLRVIHNVLMGRLGHWRLHRAMLSLLLPRERERAAEALRRVELEEKLWSLPGTLSGGEQQRVAIARLMVQEPAVMLADEPVSSLDHRLGRAIIDLLVDEARRHDRTLIMSLHTLDMLDDRFDRIIALRGHGVFWEGAPKELNRAVLRELYGAEYDALQLDELPLGT